jgi:hypothetical protein
LKRRHIILVYVIGAVVFGGTTAFSQATPFHYFALDKDGKAWDAFRSATWGPGFTAISMPHNDYPPLKSIASITLPNPDADIYMVGLNDDGSQLYDGFRGKQWQGFDPILTSSTGLKSLPTPLRAIDLTIPLPLNSSGAVHPVLPSDWCICSIGYGPGGPQVVGPCTTVHSTIPPHPPTGSSSVIPGACH